MKTFLVIRTFDEKRQQIPIGRHIPCSQEL